MAEKMNGGTLVRKVRQHDCAPPAIKSNAIGCGDEWTCGDCGSLWVVVASPDQREPDDYWQRKTNYAVLRGPR